ncbi:mechanosensitive ion channel domain-containing protein [Synechococcus sp. BA-124 BA4]|uniref:mechanosensitive ion channel domain-containing protein n=1 Tax=unclassified Synechococcus TaxID=2626047 RepID=UPI0018CE6BFD|nr:MULTISPECIES: mechanosensitive ion channel domain-containing protein [unclassified Synechococcus]MEA5400706.1 mechanosensitive ion channel domain-containing protein [Synechococcus sp. BA-124 BA4]QPN57790.1 mechanosensitive ion channel [Synechococcus sp. CBW1107]CAK6687340.1 hypothetical protein BBFGKLBO_00194 [Synechococcus sp. CBW1107]
MGTFAAGVVLQIFRPISGGDYIEGGGVEDTVEEVGMFVTSIASPANVSHIVANGKLDNSADMEVLEFTERGPKLAVRPPAHTSHYL